MELYILSATGQAGFWHIFTTLVVNTKSSRDAIMSSSVPKVLHATIIFPGPTIFSRKAHGPEARLIFMSLNLIFALVRFQCLVFF